MKKISGKWWLVIAYAIVILLCIFASGCSPAKIRSKALDAYKASSKFPGDCADSFPPRIDTNYLPGIVVVDTFWYDKSKHPSWPVRGLPTWLPQKDTTGQNFKVIEIRTTVRDTLVLRVKDRAKEVELERQLTEQQEQAVAIIEDLKQQQKKELEKFLKGLDQVEKSGAKNAKRLATRTKQRNWLFFILLGAGLWQFRHLLIRLITKQ